MEKFGPFGDIAAKISNLQFSIWFITSLFLRKEPCQGYANSAVKGTSVDERRCGIVWIQFFDKVNARPARPRDSANWSAVFCWSFHNALEKVTHN